ncbi:alpha-amylase family glycosyl hydrolase [Kouleothrix sp.]|uniref:alpha-amylase family glycosyl hydrolase n=1 Tax=Kouleothrix sp. TaxID=2779161 RepID=UPI00391D1E8A
MTRTTRLRALALTFTLLLAACAGQQATAPTAAPATVAAPAPATVAAPATATATAVPATATAVPAATPTRDLPTQAPTITAAPTATPFALQAGWWDNAVCYEVFVRSFYDSNGDGIGDLNGLIAKLDYINDGNPKSQSDLGATCIWLMPIMESPSYHGYDVTDYYNVNHEYGTNDDFKRLVAEAHKRGIKVILDLVLNHTSSEHPWFKDALKGPESPYRDWYLWSKDKPDYQTPWGSEGWHQSPVRNEYYYGIFWEGMPDLNYRNPAVTAEAQKISAFWLNDMGADGFRLDAIKHLIEDGPLQEGTRETHAWLRGYRAFLQQTKPGTFTVGEIFGASPTVLLPYYPDQLDEYFAFEAGDKIISAANTGQALGFTIAIANNYAQLPFQRWAPFLTNHDQNRVMTTLGGDVGKAKIAATALLTLPGLPFVYYGEEIGMLGAKPDEQIRNPLQWAADDTTGGFTSGKPWEALQKNYKEVNIAAQNADPASLLNLYRRLIHLHTQHPALAQGSFVPLKSSSTALSAFVRKAAGETVLVVLNFGKDAVGGATLSLEASDLAPGTYRAAPLLGDQPGARLTVGAGGAISGYAPLPELAPRTGYIFQLAR